MGIWAEVLGIDRPGIHDNFFHLGGHSLAATQVVTRLRHEFGIDLPIESLFVRPTVAGLAELLAQALRASQAQPLLEPPVRKAEVNSNGPSIPPKNVTASFSPLFRPAAAVVSRPGRARQSRLQHARRLAQRRLGRHRPRAEPQRDPAPPRSLAHDLSSDRASNPFKS